MTQIEFASALIRLNKNRIGITEACVLFSIGEGATNYQISKATSTDRSTTKARVGVLKRKGLVRQVYDENGQSKYKPTPLGEKLVWQTLKQKATT